MFPHQVSTSTILMINYDSSIVHNRVLSGEEVNQRRFENYKTCWHQRKMKMEFFHTHFNALKHIQMFILVEFSAFKFEFYEMYHFNKRMRHN